MRDIESGSKSSLIKRQIINYYIYNGCSTIPDLSKELNLSVPTVTKFINEMHKDGDIMDYGKLETAGGRHPHLYGLNADSGYFIGVDICRFSVNIGVINFKGDMVVSKFDIPYSFENTEESFEHLIEIVKGFIEQLTLDKSKILNINFNISGRVNPDSGYSYTIFNFEDRSLADILAERIGYKVSIDNDTRGMAHGELIQGCVKNEKNILFINIGWGLGMGIIIDGKPYKGKSGFSGELGHIHFCDNQIICHCGKKGCMETEASGIALHRILLERIQSGETSILSIKQKNNEEITLSDIVEAIRKEDVLCIDILEEMGQKLGRQIAALINLFNPEMVIIGGMLSLTGDYITQPIKSSVRKYSLNLVNKDTTIVTSKLQDKAGIIGACMLARSKMFEN